MTVRIDLTEPKRLLAEAERVAGDDPESALALATMGMLAYTIAAADAGMRAVDEIMAESVTATGVTVSSWSRK